MPHIQETIAITTRHPLEPLSANEVRATVELLNAAGKITPTTRFVSIALKEPNKAFVHNASAAEVPDREAQVVLFDNAKNACFEANVSITNGTVLSWKHVPGVQPTMTIDEQVECEQAVLNSPEFKAKLKEHTGVDDTSLVMVDIWSAGNYGDPEDSARRLARPLCFLRSDPTDNGYVRPIEGLRPVVDLNTMHVVRIDDHGRWPIPPGEANYAGDRMTRFSVRYQASGNCPAGRAQLHRQRLSSFLAKVEVRRRLQRSRRAHASPPSLRRQVHSVPRLAYGDGRAVRRSGPTQRRKNAFDVGEYGMGMCANSLVLGCDCLGFIHYFDAHLCDSRGAALTIQNAVCMHEEDYGILWKHTDRRLPDAPEVRRSRRLVVSSVSTVENYEYGFFWYLYQDGTIQFEIKLTGILSLASTHPGETPKHGNLVAPQLYAPNHQHFFNMRLDFDLNGVNNTVQRVDVVADPIDDDNPFENAFQARATPLKSEQAARGNLSL